MFKRDKLLSSNITNNCNWIFNEQVAKVFPDMVSRSIPGYLDIINIIGMLARHFVQPKTRIYDLGCSLGTVALAIYRNISNKDCKIIAIDNSSAMIEFSKYYIYNYNTPSIPIKIIKGDIRNTIIKNSSMIVLNFTMQFLSKDDRQLLLNKIYQGLNKGGILVLSEKINFEDFVIDKLLFNLHHSFKKINGYSNLEIKKKQNMLKNVMFTDSIKIHTNRLKRAGFQHIGVCFQYFNFTSLIALKMR